MSTATLACKAVYGTGVDYRVTGTMDRDANLSSFNRFVTLGLMTGAAGIQTYLTPDEAEQLAAMLANAALEVRAQVQPLKEAA